MTPISSAGGGYRLKVDTAAQKRGQGRTWSRKLDRRHAAVPGSISCEVLDPQDHALALAIGDGRRADRDACIRRQALAKRRLDAAADEAEADRAGRRAPIEAAGSDAEHGRRRRARQGRRGGAAAAVRAPSIGSDSSVDCGTFNMSLSGRAGSRRSGIFHPIRFMPARAVLAANFRRRDSLGRSVTKG